MIWSPELGLHLRETWGSANAAALIVIVASHRWNAAQCQQQNNRQKHVFHQYVPKHVCSMIDRSAQIGIGCAINYAPRHIPHLGG